MSRRRLWIAGAVVFTALTVQLAIGQDEKNEVSGVVGRSFVGTQAIQGATFFDPNIRYGRGTTIEGSYARRLLLNPICSFAVEVPVLFNPDEDIHAGGPGLAPGDYSALFVAPSVRANLFPETAVSLWGSVGGGVGHISQNSKLLYGGTNTGKNTTSGVLQYGVGLDVKFTRRFYVRVEGRDYWAGEPDFPQAPTGKSRQHNYFVGGGVMWRF
jgi:hypothetical protein